MVNQIIFSSILQTWYVELRISRSISESPLEFEITRVDCIRELRYTLYVYLRCLKGSKLLWFPFALLHPKFLFRSGTKGILTCSSKIQNICSVRIGPLPQQWNRTVKHIILYTMIYQNKRLNGDLMQGHKKTTTRPWWARPLILIVKHQSSGTDSGRNRHWGPINSRAIKELSTIARVRFRAS